MPRDASGNCTSPVSAAVTATVATAAWMNSLASDIYTLLSDSLSRSGKGGMTNPFQLADGTAGAPALTFTNENTSGWFRSAAGKIALALLGTKRVEIDSNGNIFAAIYTNQNGNASSLQGNSADGVSAVGVVLDNTATLSNASAKLISIRNAGVEKSYFDKNGAFSGPNSVVAACSVSASGTILQQKGAVTLTGAGTSPPNAKFATGSYKITVPGVTANAILIATCQGANAVIEAYYLSADTVSVGTFVDTTGVGGDCAFSLLVVAL